VLGIEKSILNCDIDGVTRELENCKVIEVINGLASFETTLLIMAVRTKFYPIVLLLLQHGAISSLEDNLGFTPLEEAITLKCFNIVALLLQNGANGEKFLFEACLLENIEAVKVLLQNGVSANVVDTSGLREYTALMIACMQGSVNTVSLLLQHSANVDAKDELGNTALDYIDEKPEKSDELRKLFVFHLRITFLSLFECCSNNNDQNKDIIQRYLFDAMIVRELCTFLSVSYIHANEV
jgi:hypothetical protein